MSILYRSATPLPDENLAGLVARAAGINIYPRAFDVLKLARLGEYRPETMPIRDPATAEELARVLGAPMDSLRPLYHRALDDNRIDFFGTGLRQFHREKVRRRLSPRALRDRAYIKAIWSVRPLTFDPGTRERLLMACPVCSKDLGFSRTWLIECCEHCIGDDEYGLPTSVVDLRDLPQPIVEVADEEALDFVVSLIDPIQDRSRPPIHADLSSLDRGQLFELAVAIGNALTANDLNVGDSFSDTSRPVVPEISPDALARSGRALLDWPMAFIGLCEKSSEQADARPGKWGMHKEFHHLCQLRHDEHIGATARVAVGMVLDQAFSEIRPQGAVPRKSSKRMLVGKWITAKHLRELAVVCAKTVKKMGQHPRIPKHRDGEGHLAPVLLDSWMAAAILDNYKDLVSEDSVCTTLGLPPDAVRGLAALGYIDDYATPARRIAIDIAAEGRYYSTQSIQRFTADAATSIPFQKPPKGYIPLAEAMLMFPAGNRPWVPVLEAIMWQRVDAVFRQNIAGQPKVKNLFGSMSLRGIEAQRDRILAEHADAPPPDDLGRVSAVVANLMLGIYNHNTFMACQKEGLLEVSSDGVAHRSILDFAERFIFANEAAVRSRNSGKTVVAWLKARDIKPLYEFNNKGGVIYDRQQVEPWLEMPRHI